MQTDLEKLIAPPLVNAVCAECGARVPEEFPSCDAMLLAVLSRRYDETRDAPSRLLVDVFAMQHPRRSCKSAKSYAGHFTGLCCALEYGGSPKVYAAVQRWIGKPLARTGLTRPRDLDRRGALTLRHVVDSANEADFQARLLEWAENVWKAYSPQHEIARRWIELALKSR